VEAWPGILQAVTEDDVVAVAREVLDRRRAVTGWAMAKAEEVTE
jgi:zinc protease